MLQGANYIKSYIAEVKGIVELYFYSPSGLHGMLQGANYIKSYIAEVKELVELYLYSPSGLHRILQGEKCLFYCSYFQFC